MSYRTIREEEDVSERVGKAPKKKPMKRAPSKCVLCFKPFTTDDPPCRTLLGRFVSHAHQRCIDERGLKPT